MKTKYPLIRNTVLAATLAFTVTALAQNPPAGRPDEGDFPPEGGPGFDGPPRFGPGGGFGPGGPGGMMQETKLVKQFDQNGDKRLNTEERKAAREYVAKERANRGPGGPGGRRGGFGPRSETQEPAQPGQNLSPADAKSFPDAATYDLKTMRTFFLEFENADWEKELSDFNNTDVEVPVKLTVDGKVYQDVGVHFRGASSFMMVPEGRKRSLNLSLDWVHAKQNLGGYRTFNLLNSHGDPTMLRAVLSHHISREYIPAPQANFVRVVINGEDWGVYVSAQQFNKDFINDWFGTTKGARWKVPGSPQGRAGLEYLGDDPAPYKRLYEIKTKDNPEVWANLIKLCKVLNQTPADQLEKALEPLLDVDGVLKFLALENVLVNSDGYWVRASDYSLYQDPKGRFHIFPHDANETFSSGGGPGGPGGPGGRGRGGPGGGPGGGGVQLDPLVAAKDSSKPLLSKLLAVPALRTRYLDYVREIAGTWLDWNKLGTLAKAHQAVIADAVKVDTRKLDSTEAFFAGLDGAIQPQGGFGPGRGQRGSLKTFAEQRREFLLNHAEVKKLKE